jgi:hypothetical protein
MGDPLADAGQPAAAEANLIAGLGPSFRDPAGDLGQPEDAEGDRDQGQPVTQEQAAEREPFLGGGGRGADHAEQ